MSERSADFAVLRAGVREMLPFGGMAVVVGVAALELQEALPPGLRTSAWWVVPAISVWGGVAIGGPSPAAALHLMLRPVGRVRLLVLRLLALWSVMFVAAVLLVVASNTLALEIQDGGPSTGWLVAATLFGTAVGAQAGLGGHREPVALGVAVLLLAGYAMPAMLAVEMLELSWTRVLRCAGAWIWPAVGVIVVAALAPVFMAWQRWWPRSGRTIVLRVTSSSVMATVGAIVTMTVPIAATSKTVAHAELLAVIGGNERGVYVAVGTYRFGDEHVEAVVEMDANGMLEEVWDRSVLADDERVQMFVGLQDQGLTAVVVRDGASTFVPLGLQSTNKPVGIGLQPRLLGRWHAQESIVRFFRRTFVVAVAHPMVHAHGRLWAVTQEGELWSTPSPEVNR